MTHQKQVGRDWKVCCEPRVLSNAESSPFPISRVFRCYFVATGGGSCFRTCVAMGARVCRDGGSVMQEGSCWAPPTQCGATSSADVVVECFPIPHRG